MSGIKPQKIEVGNGVLGRLQDPDDCTFLHFTRMST